MKKYIAYCIGGFIFFVGLVNIGTNLLVAIFNIILGLIIALVSFLLTNKEFKEKNNFTKKYLHQILNDNFSDLEKDYIADFINTYAVYKQDLSESTNYFEDFTKNNKCYFSNEFEFKALCLACSFYLRDIDETIQTFKEEKGILNNFEVDYKNAVFDFIAYFYKLTLINSLYPFQCTPLEIQKKLEDDFYRLLIKNKK